MASGCHGDGGALSSKVLHNVYRHLESLFLAGDTALDILRLESGFIIKDIEAQGQEQGECSKHPRRRPSPLNGTRFIAGNLFASNHGVKRTIRSSNYSYNYR